MHRALVITAILVVATIAGFTGCGTTTSGGDASPEIVAPAAREAPARIRVPALNGRGTVNAGFASSRPTVVNMWASWCGPCREEMPAVQRFAAAHPNVRVIGVAVRDQPDDARAFAREVGVTFPLGFDADNRVADAYAVSGLPTTVILDTDGRLAATWPGPVTSADLTRLTSAAAIPN